MPPDGLLLKGLRSKLSKVDQFISATRESRFVDDSSGVIESRYRIDGIPSHFFIDSSGVLREMRISSLNPSTIGENLAEIGVDVGGSSG